MNDTNGPSDNQPAGQPPYAGPPQQWQQPGQPGPQGSRVNKKIVAVAVVVLLLVVGGIVAAVLLIGDDKDDSGEGQGSGERSPVETVQQLVRAAEEGDCPAVQALMVDGDTYECDDLLGNAEDYELKSATEKSVEGDKAVVETEYLQGGSTDTEDFPLTKVDGEWLVDLGDEASGSDSDSESSQPGTTEVDPEADDGDGADTGGTRTQPVTDTMPLAITDTFVNAIKGNQCDVAKAFLVDPDAADCSEITRDDAEGITFGEPEVVTQDDESATTQADMSAGGSSVGKLTVHLVVTDTGDWKIESWDY